MKTLDQSVFYLPECPPEAESAAVDADGRAHWFDVKLNIREHRGDELWGEHLGHCCKLIGSGYDTSNWKHSVIYRKRAA